jgi:DtxR family Mn-dependent transcriptional regulator
MSPGPLSRSVEDYLKAIYGLCESADPASTSAIAETLDIQPASVTGMVKRLAESGLLEYVPYRGVRLTRTGTREALRVLRRHRILETYLCERLGFSWDDGGGPGVPQPRPARRADPYTLWGHRDD